MAKVKLEVEETLKYRREIIVEVPDEMDDGDLEQALNMAQKHDNLQDFMLELEDHGIEAPDGYDDDLSSPSDMDVECDGYDFIKEEKVESA